LLWCSPFRPARLGALRPLGSAVRVATLPRRVPSRLSRAVFLAMRALFQLRMRRSWSYERRDYVLAFYAPVSLLALLLVWATLLTLGYTAIYWALGDSLVAAFEVSGSSIFTLGLFLPGHLPS